MGRLNIKLKQIFKETVKKPVGNEKYIFLFDDDDERLCTELFGDNYFPVFVSKNLDANSFTAEEFIDCICSISEHPYARDYYYLPICSYDTNTYLLEELKKNNFKYSNSIWKMFSDKSTGRGIGFYKNNSEELKRDIVSFINKCEGKPTVVPKLKIKRVSEYRSKEIEYLLYPYLPKGAYSIIAGVPGSSKTWITLYIAALLSNGGEFITDRPKDKRSPSVVIYQSKENDTETVVRPRLEMLGANLDNIIIIEDKDEDGNGVPLTLTDGRLEEAIKAYNPAAVIFDPIQSYLGEGVDMHRANEVRPIMDKIMALGNEYNCSFIIVMHLSKMTAVGALDRILGSVDFRAAARSILIVGSDPEDRERRVIAHAKFNNGKYGESIAYKIDNGISIEGFVDFNEDQIVRSEKEKARDKPSVSLDEACTFLIDILGEQGFEHTRKIKEEAEKQGIGERTLYNAKKDLQIVSHRIGRGKNHLSWWTMPDITEEDISDFVKPYDVVQLELSNSTDIPP